MTLDKVQKISALSKALYEKQERVRVLGMTNTPTDPQEREKAFIENHLAEAEAHEALMALRAAVHG